MAVIKTESFRMGEKLYNTIEEFELARKFDKVTTFKCSDGTIFGTEWAADNHEKSIQPYRAELKDALNKILILAEVNKDKNDDYLENIQKYVSKVINSEYEADQYETQYHNSNCY